MVLAFAVPGSGWAYYSVTGTQGRLEYSSNWYVGVKASNFTDGEYVTSGNPTVDGSHVSSIYLYRSGLEHVETGWVILHNQNDYHYTDGSQIPDYTTFMAYRDNTLYRQFAQWGPRLSKGSWYYFEINRFAYDSQTGLWEYRANAGGTGTVLKQKLNFDSGNPEMSGERRYNDASLHDTNFADFSNAQFKKTSGSWYKFTAVAPETSIHIDDYDDYYNGTWHSGFSGNRDFTVD